MNLDPAHLFNKALEALDAGDAEAAQRWLRATLLQTPGDTEAALMLSEILVDSNQRPAAIALLTGHLEYASTPEDALVELADLHLQRGATQEAVDAIRLVLSTKPNHWQALSLLGDAFLDVGAPDEACRAFEHALSANPFGATLWFNLGCARTAVENWSGASEAFSGYLRCAPEADDRAEVAARVAALDAKGDAREPEPGL